LNAFDLDFQNKVDDFPKDFELGGPRVKCWSSEPSRTRETAGFKQYSLQIVERCEDVELCRQGKQDLPVISYMKDGKMVATAIEDLQAEIIKPNTDYVQLARFDFDLPTFNYDTQMPDPLIFWMANGPDGKDKAKDRTVRPATSTHNMSS
jgi:hypothetical protein